MLAPLSSIVIFLCPPPLLQIPSPLLYKPVSLADSSNPDSSTCLHHSHAQTKTQTLLKTPNSGLSIQLHQLQHPERLCRSGMILQCSNPSKYIEDYSNVRIRPAAEICYKRVVWDSTPDIQTPGLRNKPSNSNNPSPQPHTQCHRQSSPSIGTGSSWHTTPQTNVSSQHYRTPRLSTANDFSIHMKDKYPNLVYTEVGIMLKEHNAIPFKMIADVKDSILKENTRFLDKIAPKLENRCTGCLKRSIPCLLQPDNQAPPPNDSTFTTPDNNSGLKYRCLYTHDSEAFSPTSSSTNKRKGLHTSHHRQTGSLSLHKPESSTAVHGKSKHDTIKSWAKTIVGGIIMYNDDIAVPDGSVILGQESARPQEKVVVNHSHYAISHWSSGSTIDFPSIALQDRLATIIYRLPIADKERFSITHTCPRFITLSSEAIADQLVGSDIIDHELFSLLIRRIRQIDQEILYPHDSSPCRHYLEPDFASSVLSSDKGPVDEICT
ncbi:uncharacterized protein [Aegilops tauschii subsp. strangulata]|uniref:Uncharacterized protein n=1 Tax=Aegilops tauschii subsp. strangulata TaxID=200361 RepID=A0A453B6Q1_AEGTS